MSDSMWDPRPRIGDPAPEPSALPDDGASGLAVLVELEGGPGMSAMAASSVGRALAGGFAIDEDFPVTEMDGGRSFLVRGLVPDEDGIAQIEADDHVLRVWRDTPIAPFDAPA